MSFESSDPRDVDLINLFRALTCLLKETPVAIYFAQVRALYFLNFLSMLSINHEQRHVVKCFLASLYEAASVGWSVHPANVKIA